MPTLVTFFTDCVCRRQAGTTKQNKKRIIPLGGGATSSANIRQCTLVAPSLTLDVFPLGDDGEDGLGAALVPVVVVPAIEYGIN